jgi:hypothetical protein
MQAEVSRVAKAGRVRVAKATPFISPARKCGVSKGKATESRSDATTPQTAAPRHKPPQTSSAASQTPPQNSASDDVPPDYEYRPER